MYSSPSVNIVCVFKLYLFLRKFAVKRIKRLLEDLSRTEIFSWTSKKLFLVKRKLSPANSQIQPSVAIHNPHQVINWKSFYNFRKSLNVLEPSGFLSGWGDFLSPTNPTNRRHPISGNCLNFIFLTKYMVMDN